MLIKFILQNFMNDVNGKYLKVGDYKNKLVINDKSLIVEQKPMIIQPQIENE